MSWRLFGAATALVLTISAAAAAPVGEFTDHRDIGRPRHAGSTSYDAATRTYRPQDVAICVLDQHSARLRQKFTLCRSCQGYKS